ncbi:hypothetical protein SAEN111111_23305 [Saccharibacillus endophyticus]
MPILFSVHYPDFWSPTGNDCLVELIAASIRSLLIALIPRTFTVTVAPDYRLVPDGRLDKQAYGENIRSFAATCFENGSLGTTRYGEPVGPVVVKALLLSLPVIAGALSVGFLLPVARWYLIHHPIGGMRFLAREGWESLEIAMAADFGRFVYSKRITSPRFCRR